MTCEQFDARLDDLVDEMLSETEQSEMEAHAGACERCGAVLRDHRDMVARLRALPKTLPTDLHEQLIHSLEEEKQKLIVQRPPKSPRPYFSLIAAVAAMLLLVVSGTFDSFFQMLSGEDRVREEIALNEAPSLEKNERRNTQENVLIAAGAGADDAVTDGDSAPEAGAADKENEKDGVAKADGETPSEPQIFSISGARLDLNGGQFEDASLRIEDGKVVSLPPELSVGKSGFFVLAAGGASPLPELEGGALVHIEDAVGYVVMAIPNNMNALQQAIAQLEDSGFAVNVLHAADGLIGSEASSGYIIIEKE